MFVSRFPHMIFDQLFHSLLAGDTKKRQKDQLNLTWRGKVTIIQNYNLSLLSLGVEKKMKKYIKYGRKEGRGMISVNN